MLIDSRPDATIGQVVLSGMERAAYEYCDEVHSSGSVARALRARYPDVEFSEEDMVRFLDSLVANRLMARDGASYLSLAIPIMPVEATPLDEGVALVPEAAPLDLIEVT